jgi:hypothetical protein
MSMLQKYNLYFKGLVEKLQGKQRGLDLLLSLSTTFE